MDTRISVSQAGGDNPSPELFSDKGGYYKFPNGLILQWGISDDINLSFPISFPHRCFSMTATREYHTGSIGYGESWRESESAGIVDVKTYNQFGAVMTGGTSDSEGGAFFGNPGKYHWLVIGY